MMAVYDGELEIYKQIDAQRESERQKDWIEKNKDIMHSKPNYKSQTSSDNGSQSVDITEVDEDFVSVEEFSYFNLPPLPSRLMSASETPRWLTTELWQSRYNSIGQIMMSNDEITFPSTSIASAAGIFPGQNN